jgi:hypothetical protein
MTEEDGGDGTRTAGRSRGRIIAATQERAFKAVNRYVEAANSLDDSGEARVAAAELHNAVMAYYRALRPLRNEEVIEDFWEGAEWEYRGDRVKGLDKLAQVMVESEEDTEHRQGFLGARTERKRKPLRLAPKTLIQLAATLDDAAVKLGFAPEVDTSDGQLYAIKRDPEEYGEPVDDSIPKPK